MVRGLRFRTSETKDAHSFLGLLVVLLINVFIVGFVGILTVAIAVSILLLTLSSTSSCFLLLLLGFRVYCY